MLKSFLLLNPIYKYLFPDMDSNTVIITKERIEHIKERHPDDYEKYAIYIPAVLSVTRIIYFLQISLIQQLL